MYSLNGISLHEGHTGWRILRDGTQTQGGVRNALVQSRIPDRPGYKPAPYTFNEAMIVFVVRTPRARLEELLNLVDAATVVTRTADPTKEARVQVASAVPNGDEPLDGGFDVTISLVIYDGVWRDVDATVVGPTNVSTPVQSFAILAGIGAPVFDADVFIRGVFGEFTLRDSGGSFLRTTKAWGLGSSTNGLLWVGATKQAFLANESAPWTPVADASQYVDVSGNGGFRLTPALVGGDPKVRRVDLQLTTLSQTSTTLRVRAKRSYRMN